MFDIQLVKNMRFNAKLLTYSGLTATCDDLYRRVSVLAWKVGLSAKFPPICSFLGGTGVGKSTLFNSFTGDAFSQVSQKRPCTRKALAFVHRDYAAELATCPFIRSEASEALLQVHDLDELASWILIDTPDFDSVLRENEQVAQNFFLLSDLILFITSQDKYADLVTHDYRSESLQWGKETVFIINKVDSAEALADFEKNVERDWGNRPVLSVERQYGLIDYIPDLAERPEFAALFHNSGGGSLRHRELRNLRRNTLKTLAHLSNLVQLENSRIAQVNAHIETVQRQAEEMMLRNAEKAVDPELAKVLKVKVVELLRKYDLLAGWRKILRQTAREVLKAASGVLGAALGSGSAKNGADNGSSETVNSVKRHADLRPLETAVAYVNERVMEIVMSDASLSDMAEAAKKLPRWGPGELQEMYAAEFPGIERLLDEEFTRLKKGLAPGDEAKLYGASIVWTTLLVTAEIVVGGGFTLLDAVVDSVIVPFFPKWALELQSGDELRAIGRKIDNAHRAVLKTILLRQAEVYTQEFQRMAPSDDVVKTLSVLEDQIRVVPLY